MSDRSGLADRLRRLRELGGEHPGRLKKASEIPSPARESRAASVESGSDLAGLGFEQSDDYLWIRRLELPNPLAEERPCRLLTGKIDLDSRLLFLDIETTGLSGGAGSVAFLVGVGKPRGTAFELTQYFLSDFPGERELIGALSREITHGDVAVSFNGKAFDVPILRSRFGLIGRRLEFADHIDLLYPSRRLFRRIIGACSLHAIEGEILGIERTNDLPGFLVPDRYFDFLRTGDLEPLRAVFDHHREDVLSLARLLDYIERLVTENGTFGTGMRVDQAELGWMMVEGSMGGGIDLLTALAEEGDRRALQLVAEFLRRSQRRGDAALLWENAWTRHRDLSAAVELAKHYEHFRKDPNRALEIVNEAEKVARLAGLRDSRLFDSLTHRRERLLRKVRARSHSPS